MPFSASRGDMKVYWTPSALEVLPMCPVNVSVE